MGASKSQEAGTSREGSFDQCSLNNDKPLSHCQGRDWHVQVLYQTGGLCAGCGEQEERPRGEKCRLVWGLREEDPSKLPHGIAVGHTEAMAFPNPQKWGAFPSIAVTTSSPVHKHPTTTDVDRPPAESRWHQPPGAARLSHPGTQDPPVPPDAPRVTPLHVTS